MTTFLPQVPPQDPPDGCRILDRVQMEGAAGLADDDICVQEAEFADELGDLPMPKSHSQRLCGNRRASKRAN